MEKQKSLRRGLAEISSQFLSTPDEESRLEQLVSRLERLEEKLGLKQLEEAVPEEEAYPVEPPTEKPPAKVPQFKQYKTILTNLRTDIGQDYIASGIIASNGIHLVFDSTAEALKEETLSAYFTDIINDTSQITDKLSLGTTQSLMITSQDCHIFLQSLPGTHKYFLCLLIKAAANIGMATLVLEQISTQLHLN
jgi:predicted regulator of Ras-like GTPase activity (Roadblock/LC7/MglB family)